MCGIAGGLLHQARKFREVGVDIDVRIIKGVRVLMRLSMFGMGIEPMRRPTVAMPATLPAAVPAMCAVQRSHFQGAPRLRARARTSKLVRLFRAGSELDIV